MTVIHPMHDTARGPVYEFTEGADDVARHVIQMAAGRPKPKVEIGRQYTGKREFYWDSRTGEYSESLPLMGWDEFLIQQALVGPLVLRKRTRENIRQSPY